MNLRCLIFLLTLFVVDRSTIQAASKVPPDHADRLVLGLELFQKQVRGLLMEHCVKCHGGEKTKGGLDLTTREGLLKGGDEGVVVQLYDSKASKLYHLITHAKEPQMPSKGKKLSEPAIEQIVAWIDHGAPYDKPLTEGKLIVKKDRGIVLASDRQWWAFQPLAKNLPREVNGANVGSSAIDRFIDSRLKKKQLVKNAAADRRTLIRRASFDLRGLPPTPTEVDLFLSDDRDDAWDRVVAGFLSSPRYGERWARHWLDVARFAESSGFEHDYDRPNAYHYRDFVIKALNADMPFDQFVRWQLAGDEFEPEEPLALMATGFLGAGVFPTQITANEVERVRYDAMDDMLATTGTAMLGLTIGCARCHDHKFDPIPSLDYYRMLSTFTTTVRSDIELNLTPTVFNKAKAIFDREHESLLKSLSDYEVTLLPTKFDAWLKSGAPVVKKPIWELLNVGAAVSKAGATFKILEDGSYLAEGKNGDSDVYTIMATVTTPGLRAFRLETMTHTNMVKGGPGRADNGNIGLSRMRVFQESNNDGKTNEIKLVNPRASFEQNSNTLSILATLDDNPKSGWAIDPKFGTNHTAVFEFEKPLEQIGTTKLIFQLEFELNQRHNIGRLRLAATKASAPSIDGDVVPDRILAILDSLHQAQPKALTSGEKGLLQHWWKPSDVQWNSLNDVVAAHARKTPKPDLTKVLVCAEGFPPLRMHTQGVDFFNETYLLNRGSTEAKRGVAAPGFLQVLMKPSSSETQWAHQPQSGAKYSGRRRALAQWMSDPENGAGHLLARVIVNRLWQHHFGKGLVATPNDFGTQGAKPTHPELIDWLASELIRQGWKLKPIHQLIMTSAVYQQNTKKTPAKTKLDPENALLSRQIPLRLEAESIRDSLLSISGVLDTNMFGSGTLDEGSRRRSIYFTVKRSNLVPVMQAFDAPEPLVSQGTRPTTTVAPQALLLMNSPQVRAWATAFSKRFSPSPNTSTSEAIEGAYRLTLNRLPSKQEKKNSLRFIENQLIQYKSETESVARAMALTDFAQVVFSLNELIYVD